MVTKFGAELKVPVERFMTREVVTVLEEISMREVVTFAGRYDCNGFPVVTREGRLVGMITKGDLLRVVQASFGNPDVWRDPVSRWMAHGLLALRPQDTVETAISLMVGKGFRSVPVIDEGSRVVGIVSRGDLMNALEGGMAG